MKQRELTEEDVKRAAEEADTVKLSALPSEEDCSHEFSPDFEEKIKDMTEHN